MYKRNNDGGGKPYDLTDDEWNSMSNEEKQKFFDGFRQRLYSFWQRRAEHTREEKQRREEQKSRFKVNETLK